MRIPSATWVDVELSVEGNAATALSSWTKNVLTWLSLFLHIAELAFFLLLILFISYFLIFTLSRFTITFFAIIIHWLTLFVFVFFYTYLSWGYELLVISKLILFA